MPKRRKCWTKSVGRYGSTVRVAERDAGGVLYLIWLDRDGKQQKRSLGHRDRDRAIRDADELTHRMGQFRDIFTGAKLTVGMLIDIYVAKGLAGRSEAYRRETIRMLSRWRVFLTSDRSVESLSPSDVEAFMQWRREASDRKLKQTTLWHDWVALNTALNFATTEKDSRGRKLITANPLADVTVGKTVKPARPVARTDFFESLRAVADQLSWQFALALVLAYASGHRIGAILNLRWDDVDFTKTEDAPYGTIHWRAEHDKLANDHTVPMHPLARQALEEARRSRLAIGTALIIHAPHDDTVVLDRRLANRWFRKAERLAGIKHVAGCGWHALRRGWASERLNLPDRAVADAGGWKDTATMKVAYQHADRSAVVRAVLAAG